MGTFIKGFKIGNVVKKYFVDDTLTEAEYPPSAKKVGDEISELDGKVDDLKSDLSNTETEVNTIGQFIGKGIIPIVKTGLYYTGTAGHAYQMTENSNSVYIDPVDVSKLIGKKLTISLDGTNDGSRVFGFCNENGIIDTAYTEAGTRSMFALRDGRYVADFTITGKFFFFSYAKFTSPTPQFVIPSETLVYTKSEIDAKETAAYANIDKLYEYSTNGYINMNQPDYIQIGTEKRIWFSGSQNDFAPKIEEGDKIAILSDDYDIGIRVGDGVPNWVKSFYVPAGDFIGYGIRKTDLSDISALTQSEIKNMVSVQRISKLLDTAAYKKAHISFDDCLFWTDLIDNENTYTSAFDNAFLSDLKSIHDATGVVFTLNCFCSTTGYDISDVPAKFATDFQQNSDWLKFSFHAEDSAATYTADNVAAITTSYNKFIASIYTMTGNVDSIDTVVRLGGFTGSLNNVLAIRDANTGITGLLTADDTRVSYYFDTDTNNFMIAHGKMFDAANQLVLIHSQLRLESVSNITTFCEQYLTPAYGNYVKNLEFFTHEYEWDSTMKTKVNSLIKWLQENKYDFDYWM